MPENVLDSDSLKEAQEQLARAMRDLCDTGEAMFSGRQVARVKDFQLLLDEAIEHADDVKKAARKVHEELKALFG